MEEDATTPTPQTGYGQPSGPVRQDHKSKRIWLGVALLLALILVGGIYFLKDQQVGLVRQERDELQDKVKVLNDRIDSLESEDTQSTPPADEETVSAQTHPTELVSGQVRQDDVASPAVVDCRVRGGELDELWVEYGRSLNLGSETAHTSSGLGLNTGDGYGSYPVSIPADDIELGQMHFYRCTGKNQEGTVQAGIASFAAQK